jgi:cardiolipin synthase
LIVFFLAGVIDLADGLIARIWQQKSPLGSYLDPLADKLLMSSSFVTLSIAHLIPPWLTVVVISRDVILAVGVLVLRLADYHVVPQPSLAGKWTTVLQAVTVLLVLIGKIWYLPPLLLQVFFWAAGGLTLVSGIHYIYVGLVVLSQSPEKKGRPEGGGG